ncbi:MAG: hypothetical protein KDI17_02075 [Halioglobus sp.]|nr:hypothetical protein [Halioglobus sp.]
MLEVPVMTVLAAALFALMAFRAIRSGTALDYLLGASQVIGVLLLFTAYREVACYLLLASAIAYLVSQLLTGARAISRLLPLAGAVAVALVVFG